MNIEDINKKIRQLRIEKGLSQKTLGEKCGITQQAVNRIEWGHGNIDIKMLIKIADALDVKVFDLLDMREYLEEKRIEKENSLLHYLYNLGIELESINGYSYIIEFQKKKYIITDDEYEKLIYSIQSFTKFTVNDLLSNKEFIENAQK